MSARHRSETLIMSIPLTQSCPECDGEMELVTTDDEGEIVVYECPDCGFQSEQRVEAEDREQDRDAPSDNEADDTQPEDESSEDDEALLEAEAEP
jgi:DNA-directed RNA polymerase subunit M/transcription elongation factor TFIIS